VKVRFATLDDTPVLTFLRDERDVLLQQAAPRVRTALTRLDFPILLNTPEANVFVATDDNDERVAGYLAAALAPLKINTPISISTSETGFLLELALDVHHYHAGMARALYRAAAAWLQSQGKTECLISVPRFYVVEQAFWRSLGAVEVDHAKTGSRAWGWMKLLL
jgi:GNAT superfamily N-acetyltransferase